MGLQPAVFYSAGQRSEHLMPGAYSRSNNVTSPSGVSTGNLCIIGSSQGGEPGKLLSFTSLADAKETLISGPLLNAIGYAFNANDNYVPQRVYSIRVNSAKQAELILKSNSTDLIKVKAWDWGVHGNQLKMSIDTEDKITTLDVSYKDNKIVTKNIIKPSLSISYSGEGEATVEVKESSIKFRAVKDDQEIEVDTFEIDFGAFTNLDELIGRINDSENFFADNLGNPLDPSNELDTGLTTVTEDTILYSNFAAFFDALKASVFTGECEQLDKSIRVVPDSTNGYVYFTGGENGQTTFSQYRDALKVLETENIQIIATPESNDSVRTAIIEHCKDMSTILNRKKRTCILGGPIGLSDDEGIAIAKGINSKLVSYVIDSALAINPISGETETISGAMVGVMLAGIEAAISVNEPLTFKPINVLEFTNKRNIPNIEKLISGGILVCNANPEDLTSYICIRGITTNQKNDLIDCERSMVREYMYMDRDLRAKYNGGVGHPNDPSTAAILQTLRDAAKEWALQGLIIKNNSDNVWNIKIKISGDKVYLTYSRYLTAPRNFVFVTATNHTFETTTEL